MQKVLHCTHCSTEVPLEAIDIEWKVGRCAGCHQLFDATFQMDGLPERPSAGAERASGNYSGSVVITEREGVFEMVHRWSHPLYLWMLFVVVLWGGWEVYTYQQALDEEGDPLRLALLGLLGGFIFYTALAGLFNSTRIEIANGRLKTSHGPLPWPGQRDLPCASISQFYVKKRFGSEGGRFYVLYAALKDGRKLSMLPARRFEEDLVFIERALESHVAIENRFVDD